MKRNAFTISATAASLLFATAVMASAQAGNQMKPGHMNSGGAVMVGGAPMYPNRTIVQNASKAGT